MITEPLNIAAHPYLVENEIVQIDLPGDTNHGRRGWITRLSVDSAIVFFGTESAGLLQPYPKTALQRTGERRVPVWRIACDDRVLAPGIATIYHEDGTRLCDNTPYALACEIVYKLMKPDHRCVITRARNGQSTEPLTRGDMRLEYS